MSFLLIPIIAFAVPFFCFSITNGHWLGAIGSGIVILVGPFLMDKMIEEEVKRDVDRWLK